MRLYAHSSMKNNPPTDIQQQNKRAIIHRINSSRRGVVLGLAVCAMATLNVNYYTRSTTVCTFIAIAIIGLRITMLCLIRLNEYQNLLNNN